MKRNKGQGSHSLIIVGLITVGLIGVLGFVGYNALQNQSSDAGGRKTLANNKKVATKKSSTSAKSTAETSGPCKGYTYISGSKNQLSYYDKKKRKTINGPAILYSYRQAVKNGYAYCDYLKKTGYTNVKHKLTIKGTMADENGSLAGNSSVSKSVYQYVNLSYTVPKGWKKHYDAEMIFNNKTYRASNDNPAPVPG